MDRQRFELSKFMDDLLRTSFSNEQGAKLIQFRPNKEVWVNADQMATETILCNMVGNALKYGEGSEVEVVLEDKVGTIEISVSDNGPGIPDADKKKVFDRFYRRGNEEVRKTKGTGIGLYLVKLLVEKHGGTVTVSDNLPKGARFTVTLPEVSA